MTSLLHEKLAEATALREDGLSEDEIAEVLGISPEALLVLTRPAAPARPSTVAHPANDANLSKTLVSWSAADDRLAEMVEKAVEGPGRAGPHDVEGRTVSRAGLARLLAEKMSLRRLKMPLLEAEERDRRTLVHLAALAVDALEDLR